MYTLYSQIKVLERNFNRFNCQNCFLYTPVEVHNFTFQLLVRSEVKVSYVTLLWRLYYWPHNILTELSRFWERCFYAEVYKSAYLVLEIKLQFHSQQSIVCFVVNETGVSILGQWAFSVACIVQCLYWIKPQVFFSEI